MAKFPTKVAAPVPARPGAKAAPQPAPTAARSVRPGQPKAAPAAKTPSAPARAAVGRAQRPPVTAWSYSRFRDWQKCPLFFKLKHLDKLPEMAPGEVNLPMQRGIEIGEALDKYLRKETAKLPPECKPLAEQYKELRSIKNLQVEQQWGLTKDWAPCAWNDWDRCWVRIKMDISFHDLPTNLVKVIDNKTGKFKPQENASYMEQLDIYAAGAIGIHPAAKGVEAELYYSDHGIVFPMEGPLEYSAAQAKAAQAKWTLRVAPLFADRKFTPRPSRACQWCPYSKAKGGPCAY